MEDRRIGGGGRLAIALAVLGSLVAFANEIVRFRRSGALDWGHVALALGVPILIYGVVLASLRGRSDSDTT
ncbi:MAG TPA: hypothetical protein VHE78_16985 [Gemmatimonadaceae bacterium]|nr:hypothetical protein [Gemmatimonadaceae bacterium]